MAAQSKVRQESRTENPGKEKDRLRGVKRREREARWAFRTEKRYQTIWQSIDRK